MRLALLAVAVVATTASTKKTPTPSVPASLPAQGVPFFSEYVEGTANRKAVELFNPLPETAVALDGFSLQWHHNGNVYRVRDRSEEGEEEYPIDFTVRLDGRIIGPRQTFVVCRASPRGSLDAVEAARCDMQIGNPGPASQAVLHTGDDAVELLRDGGANALPVVVDVIGKVGTDPGKCWTNAAGQCMTKDATMRRRPEIRHGTTVFTPSQWTILAVDEVGGLGGHHVPCKLGRYEDAAGMCHPVTHCTKTQWETK